MDNFPLVSIIIRTCGKHDVLNNALRSVREQTYNNIEVVVVEDGENLSEHFIRENYSDLRIRYQATQINQGRAKAGNVGLAMAEGMYCNFLDDDDILLPWHVETLVDSLKRTDAKVAYAVAEEQQIVVKSDSPYRFVVKRKLIRYRYPFNRLLLCHINLFPIQSVMFSRSLFELCGGFDEKIELLEDWDLWLRFAMEEDFQFVDKVTSVYYTPYKSRKKHSRDKLMHGAECQLLEKHRGYCYTTNASQVSEEVDYILKTFNQKKAIVIMRKIRDYLLYRDR